MPKRNEENSVPLGDQILVEVHFFTKLPDCTCCLKSAAENQHKNQKQNALQL